MPIFLNDPSLYAAMSVILVGEDFLKEELQLSTVLSLIRNQSKITYAAHTKGLHLIDFDYPKEIMNAASNGQTQSSCHLIGLCWAIQKACFLVYPSANTSLTNMAHHSGRYVKKNSHFLMKTALGLGWVPKVGKSIEELGTILRICNQAFIFE